MYITKKKNFDNISQRILYGYNFIYSEFESIESAMANNECQKMLHNILGQIIDKLYYNPALLDLSLSEDESYDWYTCNNQKPELNAIYLDVFKKLNQFYKFLYIIAKIGEIENNTLIIDFNSLKLHKIVYKPSYKNLLKEINIDISKDKDNILLHSINEFEIFNAMKLLANSDLFNFIRCSYNGNSNYILNRIDDIYNYNGLLLELQKQCLEKGYNQTLFLGYGPTNFCFSICFQTQVGGFRIGYNPRKYQQFHFGTWNGIGVKAMLENYEQLNKNVQKLLLDICNRCSHCHGCTHGGKIKGGRDQNIVVMFENEKISICSLFPKIEWDYMDITLMNCLFDYHEMQIVYNPT